MAEVEIWVRILGSQEDGPGVRRLNEVALLVFHIVVEVVLLVNGWEFFLALALIFIRQLRFSGICKNRLVRSWGFSCWVCLCCWINFQWFLLLVIVFLVNIYDFPLKFSAVFANRWEILIHLLQFYPPSSRLHGSFMIIKWNRIIIKVFFQHLTEHWWRRRLLISGVPQLLFIVQENYPIVRIGQRCHNCSTGRSHTCSLYWSRHF